MYNLLYNLKCGLYVCRLIVDLAGASEIEKFPSWNPKYYQFKVSKQDTKMAFLSNVCFGSQSNFSLYESAVVGKCQ